MDSNAVVFKVMATCLLSKRTIIFTEMGDRGILLQQKMAKKIYSHYKKAGFLYKGKPIDRRNYDEAIQSYLNSQNS